jgi:hypothetical protein
MLESPKKKIGSLDENNWLAPLLKETGLSAADLTYDFNLLRGRASKTNMCVLCKGGKFLCGKTRCSVLAKAMFMATLPLWIFQSSGDLADSPSLLMT